MPVLEIDNATGVFANETWLVPAEDFGPRYGVLSVVDPFAWQVQTAKHVPSGTVGDRQFIALEATSERQPLLLWALRKRK